MGQGRKFPLILLSLIGLLAVAAVGTVAMFELRYFNKAYPGVHLQGADVSGRSAEEIFSVAVVKAQSFYNTPAITLKAGDRSVTYRASEFGTGVDPALTVQRALDVGRKGDLMTRLNERFTAYRDGVDVLPQGFSDDDAARRILERFAGEVERPVRDAAVKMDGITAREVTASPGVLLDHEGALQRIRASISGTRAVEIELPTKSVAPRIASAREAVDDANRMLLGDLAVMIPKWDDAGNPITPAEAFHLRSNEVKDYLTFQEVTDAGGLTRIATGIQLARLKTLVTPLAPTVLRPSDDARYVFDEASGELKQISAERKGSELDVDATANAIVDAMRTGKSQVGLVLKATDAQFGANLKAHGLGVVKLLAQATTNFAGSSAARVKNIKVAAARYHGLLVAPGATFSFNEFLGDVSEKEGFEEGLIIVGDRTIKGVGGGVCQVSTTVYQTALRAGFPIVERYPHGYRVGYYERGMGPGFDATVFAPYVDLKFVNDTAGHLLIESYFNPAGQLTFKFYGTPDTREVTLGKSILKDTVKHGPDIYEPDPDGTLKDRQVKQVDYATDGATAEFSRTVKKDGKLVINEKVTSKYVAWQAVYRFGPGFVPPEGAQVRTSQ